MFKTKIYLMEILKILKKFLEMSLQHHTIFQNFIFSDRQTHVICTKQSKIIKNE